MNEVHMLHGRNEARVQNFTRKKIKRKNHLEEQDIDGRVLLKGITMKQDTSVLIGFIWPNTGTSYGLDD
jgi:hypothetical protein